MAGDDKERDRGHAHRSNGSEPVQAASAELTGQGTVMMPPYHPKNGRSIGDASWTARPIPLWRLRSGPRSSPIDQCSDIAPRTSARLQRLTFHQVPFHN